MEISPTWGGIEEIETPEEQQARAEAKEARRAAEAENAYERYKESIAEIGFQEAWLEGTRLSAIAEITHCAEECMAKHFPPHMNARLVFNERGCPAIHASTLDGRLITLSTVGILKTWYATVDGVEVSRNEYLPLTIHRLALHIQGGQK